jgi:AcrR family transcriptional regulator
MTKVWDIGGCSDLQVEWLVPQQRKAASAVSEFAFAGGAMSPRKRPEQVRSADTVAAILTATIRVLEEAGDALTTTRVAQVAGVSVGTLYQYFGNREALITGVLADHLESVIVAVEVAAEASRGLPRAASAEAIARAFVAIKAASLSTTLLLDRVYGIGRFDDRAVVAAATRRARLALAPLWSDRPEADALRRAGIVCAALEGVARAAIAEDPRMLLDPEWRDQVVALAIGAIGA